MSKDADPKVAARRLAKLYPAIWRWLGNHADYIAPLANEYPTMHLRRGVYDKGKPYYDLSLSDEFLQYLDMPPTLAKARDALTMIKRDDKPAYMFAALKMRGWTSIRIAETLGQKAWGDDRSKRLVRARLRIMSAIIDLIPEESLRKWGLLAAKANLREKAHKYFAEGGPNETDRYRLLLRSGWQQIVSGERCEVIFPHPRQPNFGVGDTVWIKRSRYVIVGEAKVIGVEPAIYNGQDMPIVGRGQRDVPVVGDIIWLVLLAEGKYRL